MSNPLTTMISEKTFTTHVIEDINAAMPSARESVLGTPDVPIEEKTKRDTRFWLVFVALCLSLLLSALDLASVGTAAPTIVSDLHGEDFSWVAAGYSLASSACLPMCGNLAQIFGRRPTMLCALVVFAVGSAISGAAPTMTTLIVGRAIQGIGGGGIQSLVNIVITDLVPLRERGLFTGITGLVWTLGTICGPFIAGSLAQNGAWRWLFYINLPLCSIAFVVVFYFLQLRTPHDSLRVKFMKLDWFGNILIIASTASCILALTWGGIRFPWHSANVLVPLIVGILGLACALYYEARWASQPTIPLIVLSNRTSICGYLAAFLHGMICMTVAFYLPTWLQAVKLADPVTSGLYILPMTATISPAAILQGLIVTKLGNYRILNFVGWMVMTIGMGLFTRLRVDTSIGVVAVTQMVQGIGMGLLYCTYFPIMASLPLSENAPAVALIQFVRTFSQAWGVAISGTILQNGLRQRLPTELLSRFPDGAELAYGVIPQIPLLPEPLKDQTRKAFADSLRVVWDIMAGLCGLGFLLMFLIKEVPLRKTTDSRWALEDKGHRRRESETSHDTMDA